SARNLFSAVERISSPETLRPAALCHDGGRTAGKGKGCSPSNALESNGGGAKRFGRRNAFDGGK
ncbi:hypothetical protein, partial [Nonomuraea sp. NPDC005701]|uniref:hypothetical protein n=1 Tax=Nonomuraea sp. NPDC005701 TaxID=3157049 RepID=UPI0033C366FB